ncbi:MAG TPA: DNA repair protein RadC [Ferruginibacter sp.]|nr:DNA repair protein RadC [Ferruginibacter sp.]
MENLKKNSTSIKTWLADERPREKLIRNGIHTLSNSELIAILINSGNKKSSALDLAKEILKYGNNNLNDLGKVAFKDLQSIPGIGQAKAITIAAAMELGRRRERTPLLEKTIVRSSKELAEYLVSLLKDYSHEVFAVIFLNRANKIKHFEIISSGGITGTIADPRIILKKAVQEGATSIVLAHNHPSGNLKPSKADEEITQKIKLAAGYFDIQVLDHIIVSEEGYFSFADEGMV